MTKSSSVLVTSEDNLLREKNMSNRLKTTVTMTTKLQIKVSFDQVKHRFHMFFILALLFNLMTFLFYTYMRVR